MSWRLAGYLGLAAGLSFVSLLSALLFSASTKAGAIVAPGLAAAGFLALNPFAGMVLLVTFSHLDALSGLLSQALPVSLFKLLTVATLGGLALMSYRKPRSARLGPGDRSGALALLFVLWIGISFLTCSYPAAGLSHSIGFVSVIVLFFLIVALVDTPARLRCLVWVLVATGLVSSLFVLLETFLGVRLVATEAAAVTAQYESQARSAGASNYNPTTAAHMLLSTVVLATVLFFEYRRFRVLSGMVMLIGAAALVLTLARSAAIAFCLAGLVYLWNNRGQKLFPFAMICGLILIAAALPFVPEVFWERMGTVAGFGEDRTLLRRLSYNIIGLELVTQHPVSGVGPGNFPLYYAGDEFRWFPGREPAPRQLHNSYLEVAAELGLVGLGLFVAFLTVSFRAGVRAAQAQVADISVFARALTYALGAYLVASLFMPNEDTKFMWILPALCVAAKNLCRPQDGGSSSGGT